MKSATETTTSKADWELVRKVIDVSDRIRIEEVGGYDTEWVIENGKVYWADLDASKEYRRAQLIVMPVREFIAEHYELLDSMGLL